MRKRWTIIKKNTLFFLELYFKIFKLKKRKYFFLVLFFCSSLIILFSSYILLTKINYLNISNYYHRNFFLLKKSEENFDKNDKKEILKKLKYYFSYSNFFMIPVRVNSSFEDTPTYYHIDNSSILLKSDILKGRFPNNTDEIAVSNGENKIDNIIDITLNDGSIVKKKIVGITKREITQISRKYDVMYMHNDFFVDVDYNFNYESIFNYSENLFSFKYDIGNNSKYCPVFIEKSNENILYIKKGSSIERLEFRVLDFPTAIKIDKIIETEDVNKIDKLYIGYDFACKSSDKVFSKKIINLRFYDFKEYLSFKKEFLRNDFDNKYLLINSSAIEGNIDYFQTSFKILYLIVILFVFVITYFFLKTYSKMNFKDNYNYYLLGYPKEYLKYKELLDQFLFLILSIIIFLISLLIIRQHATMPYEFFRELNIFNIFNSIIIYTFMVIFRNFLIRKKGVLS